MATRKGFDSEYEEVYKWMTNWKLNDDQLGELMLNIQENEENPIKGAQKWVDENQDIVAEWMK